MTPKKFTQEKMREVRLLVGVRLIVVSVILGVGSFILPLDRLPFYLVIAGFYLMSLGALLLLKTRLTLSFQISVQLVLDLVGVLAVLHFSGGGVDSVFISLALLPLIGAGILLPWGGAMLFALLASVGYLALVSLEQAGLWMAFHSGETPVRTPIEWAYLVGLRLILLWVVTILAAALSRKLNTEHWELAKLQNLHNIILDQIGSGILTVNLKNEIVFVNKGAQQLIGAPARELLGTNWKSLFFFANSNFSGEAWDESSQAVRGFEVTLRRKDGLKIPIGFNVSVLRDMNGATCGKVMIFRDLTRIKELERKKQQAERLAAIGEMAAGIAHEIRNPLASISGSVEVLVRKKAFDPKYASLVDIILREGHRLNGIIESFLNYTRRPELDRRWMDMHQVIEEVILLLRHNGKWLPSIRIKMENQIEGKTHFWFDANQMKQVFYNLLVNACEAMPEGGDIRVRICETADVPSLVRVEIADSGVGITEDRLKKIFTPFFTTKQTGTGIGLPIVHRIIQDHGGTIEVKSQAGKGATFAVQFPRGEEMRGAA